MIFVNYSMLKYIYKLSMISSFYMYCQAQPSSSSSSVGWLRCIALETLFGNSIHHPHHLFEVTLIFEVVFIFKNCPHFLEVILFFTLS